MSKKLKFDKLASPRRLRSGKVANNESLSVKTSAYFANEGTSFVKIENKQRVPSKPKPAAIERAVTTLFNKSVSSHLTQGEILKKDIKKASDASTYSLAKVQHEVYEEEGNVEFKESTNVRKVSAEKGNIKIKCETIESTDHSSKLNKTPTETVKFKAGNAKRQKKRSPIKIKCENSNMKAGSTDSENVNIDAEGDRNKWTPPNWKETLEHIKEMRKHRSAPVDEMGCHKCADPNATDRVFRYQSLIALMLSSQTKDQVTHAATQRLNAYGCSPEIIAATPDDVLEKLIYPVGFYKRKVSYIKKSTEILIDKYGGDIPKSVEELCGLPGVGPKMAHICMQIAWGEVSGIGVDTHVHRICNRLGWVRKLTKAPEETRMELEDWLPKGLWKEVNHLLVGFGQEICLPRFPKCGKCLNKSICPYATKHGVKLNE